ncbi:hypothetical protein AO501_29080 [Mycobacterium gordonae]|uniref:PPE family protein n=1 Tax=Mycobacterium gordonae TaxID=1778 RepID=A0A0Q2X4R7_MYCGO|nr:PPE family protein [Mycobacterium gordonae]KQH76300.1 hypothetical protein AO501_29080 [Mycobacterium gordonae]
MIAGFTFLPPEVNSGRIFAGAGSGPLYVAAAAWDALATDLYASAASFDSVITALTGESWSGPASMAMAAMAAPYVGWLSAAAAQAATAAGQARAAATVFETALAATVHPLAVTANRTSLTSLIVTNFLGQNAPAIAATEFDYSEMWAQDVSAMVGYFTGALSVASTLTPFSMPPVDLAGVVSRAGVQAVAIGTQAATQATAAVATVPIAATAVQSLAAALPLQQVSSIAQLGAVPASTLISPMLQLAQSAQAGAAGLAGGAADLPKFVGDTAPAMQGLGAGAGGLGVGADLGKARLVGAMSVPPTWQGAMPKTMSSAALSGLGALPAEAQNAASAGGGIPAMPMPMGGGAGGGKMAAGMSGRGAAGSHVMQNRPGVIPRRGL